ncbi:MAG: hypothetical protein ACOY0T_00730 [Myxococcota bacterium]
MRSPQSCARAFGSGDQRGGVDTTSEAQNRTGNLSIGARERLVDADDERAIGGSSQRAKL